MSKPFQLKARRKGFRNPMQANYGIGVPSGLKHADPFDTSHDASAEHDVDTNINWGDVKTKRSDVVDEESGTTTHTTTHSQTGRTKPGKKTHFGMDDACSKEYIARTSIVIFDVIFVVITSLTLFYSFMMVTFH